MGGSKSRSRSNRKEARGCENSKSRSRSNRELTGSESAGNGGDQGKMRPRSGTPDQRNRRPRTPDRRNRRSGTPDQRSRSRSGGHQRQKSNERISSKSHRDEEEFHRE